MAVKSEKKDSKKTEKKTAKTAKTTAKKTGKASTKKAAKPAAKKASKTEKKTVKASKPAAKKTAKTASKKVVKTSAKKSIKKRIDWANLSFAYIETDKSYVSIYKDGKWDNGKLVSSHKIELNECACVFQYAQTCFEGLKAYTTEHGDIVTFRPDLNADRMADSCRRLEMPVFPKDRFIEAVLKVVEANKKWVPPYGSGATLYIRPYVMGINSVIGVKPATEYMFRILVTPVGPYFKGGAKPINVRISDLDRAAPHGTGDIKAGLNYDMSLHNIVDAHKCGYAENMYLDPATHTYLEETGGANIIFISKDGKLVTPKSDSILPSITRRSLVIVAKEYLHMEVEERKINKNELGNFVECGLCGTAAVISPVGQIDDHGKSIIYNGGKQEMGPKMKEIYDTLTGIQMGRLPAPEGWVYTI